MGFKVAPPVGVNCVFNYDVSIAGGVGIVKGKIRFFGGWGLRGRFCWGMGRIEGRDGDFWGVCV